VIVFTDDDCVPQPGWLAALLAGIERGADIVQGRTEPDPARIAEHGPFGRTMKVPHEEGYYETCNVAYRRDLLERLGGFDESFRVAEDVDLAWRGIEAGARTGFVSDALVHHAVFPSDWWAAARTIDRSASFQRALRLHPGARRHLGKRVFHRPAHAASLAAAAAGVAVLARPRSGRRWIVALLVGGRYAWVVRQVRHRPPRRSDWLKVVPAAFVLDLYETAVYTRASIRERSLLL
jgi:GT2 family glycosyltransferase